MDKNKDSFEMEESYKKRTDKRDKKRKKINVIKIIFIIVLIGLASFFGYKAFNEILSNRNKNGDTISYTSAAQSKSSFFKNFLVTITIDGVKIINQSGIDVLEDVCLEVSTYIKGMTEPVFVSNNKIMLIYDISGRTAVLFSDNGIIKAINFNNDIIKAKMSDSGQFVFITKDAAMKAAVRVFNNDGNELFSWYSGTGYVVDAQLSNTKNVLAVLTNEVIESRISSKVLFFTFDNPEPYMGKVIGEKVANYISFFGDASYIVCEDCLYYIDSDGYIDKVVDFGKRKLEFFKSFKDGSFMLCYDASDGKYNVSVYNKKGKETGNFLMDSFLSIADVSEDEFLVLKRKSVVSVNKKGKIKREIDCAFDVKNACYYKDKIAVLSPDSIILY